jgi:hypothetical protein
MRGQAERLRGSVTFLVLRESRAAVDLVGTLPAQELGDLSGLLDFKGMLLTLKPCTYNSRQLPDAVTCGERCTDFPACLPLPSPEILATVSQFSADAERERSSAEAVACALSDVYEAVTEELGEDPG